MYFVLLVVLALAGNRFKFLILQISENLSNIIIVKLTRFTVYPTAPTQINKYVRSLLIR